LVQGYDLADILTRDFQKNADNTTTYIHNVGGWGGIYLDTSHIPAPGCVDVSTLGNCPSDPQTRAEITKAMNANGWTEGYNKILCLHSGAWALASRAALYGGAAGYTGYCSHHYSFVSNGQIIIYRNLGYADPAQYCAYPANLSPNGAPAAYTAFSIATREISEAMTDPDGSSGRHDYAINGGEIGDLCSWTVFLDLRHAYLARPVCFGQSELERIDTLG